MSTEINMPPLLVPLLIEMIILIVMGIYAFLPGNDRSSRRYFAVYFFINLISGILFIVDILTYRNINLLYFSIFLALLEYIFFSFLPLFSTFFLLHCCKENRKTSLLFRITALSCGIYYVLLLISQFTGIFFYTDTYGRFYRTQWHPLLFVPVIVIMIANLAYLIIKRKKLSQKYFFVFLISIMATTIAIAIHAFIFNIMVINLAYCVSSLATYILIITNQIEQFVSQQTAIADQNARILVLQMRPHFIYNTMTSVYYLCEQDSKKAQQVILDFTTYLRKNFTAIANKELILFSEELEHIQAYLAVVKAQFDSSLYVDYDITYTKFRLPPLTLQPLVENSVKYGIDPDSDPLHILIQTRESDLGSDIIVKDDGPGFDATDIFEQNNALSNIKKRLEMMCHGTISISSAQGEGTIIKICIPPTETDLLQSTT